MNPLSYCVNSKDSRDPEVNYFRIGLLPSQAQNPCVSFLLSTRWYCEGSMFATYLVPRLQLVLKLADRFTQLENLFSSGSQALQDGIYRSPFPTQL